MKDIPNIIEILRAYSDEDIYAMRMSLAKHWQAFMWPQVSGLALIPTPFILQMLAQKRPNNFGLVIVQRP